MLSERDIEFKRAITVLLWNNQDKLLDKQIFDFIIAFKKRTNVNPWERNDGLVCYMLINGKKVLITCPESEVDERLEELEEQ